MYLDYVLFIQEYVPIQIYSVQSNHLTPGRLMRKAAKKTRQAGEKRIAARDIRKVTMVCSAHLGIRPSLIMTCRLRCGNSEDDRSKRAAKHYLIDSKSASIPSSMPWKSVWACDHRQESSEIDLWRAALRNSTACCIQNMMARLSINPTGEILQCRRKTTGRTQGGHRQLPEVI